MTRLLAVIRRLAPFTTAALALSVVYVGWEFLSRRTAERNAEDRIRQKEAAKYLGLEADSSSGLKILHFYAAPAVFREGDRGVLCYGVREAASVKLEPAIADLSPSPNRCIAIEPVQTTEYTLTAAGAGGMTVSASFVLQVTPDPDKQPKIVYFSKGGKQQDGARTIYSLCFETRNAREVRIEPRVFPPGPLFRGCFYVAPEVSTTYRLTVTDARGRQAERELAVKVP